MKRFNRSRIAGAAVMLVFSAVIVLLVHSTPAASPDTDIPRTVIYFLDIGQGDSQLIVSGSDTILIDGGPRSSGKELIKKLDALGVDHLTAIIATHPHHDHIGGLINVLNNWVDANNADGLYAHWVMDDTSGLPVPDRVK